MTPTFQGCIKLPIIELIRRKFSTTKARVMITWNMSWKWPCVMNQAPGSEELHSPSDLSNCRWSSISFALVLQILLNKVLKCGSFPSLRQPLFLSVRFQHQRFSIQYKNTSHPHPVYLKFVRMNVVDYSRIKLFAFPNFN